MTRQKMTGGEAVVAQLLAHDVDTIFGIPGGQNLAIYDALCSERARIRHLLGRHEQGLTYMADGYSRASGRLGVVNDDQRSGGGEHGVRHGPGDDRYIQRTGRVVDRTQRVDRQESGRPARPR